MAEGVVETMTELYNSPALNSEFMEENLEDKEEYLADLVTVDIKEEFAADDEDGSKDDLIIQKDRGKYIENNRDKKFCEILYDGTLLFVSENGLIIGKLQKKPQILSFFQLNRIHNSGGIRITTKLIKAFFEHSIISRPLMLKPY